MYFVTSTSKRLNITKAPELSMATSSSSSGVSMVKGVQQKQHQVFINFRGKELRNNFISHLETALKHDKIKYYIDMDEARGHAIEILFTRIEQSDLALAVFSKGYSESKWCLDELVKIMQTVEKKKLMVIPIFFDVKVDDVQNQTGAFGDNFKNCHNREEPSKKRDWEEALQSATKRMGLTLARCRYNSKKQLFDHLNLLLCLCHLIFPTHTMFPAVRRAI